VGVSVSKLKVVLYTGGYDTGGQGFRIKRAFDRYYPDEFEVRSIHTSASYFAYPSDVQARAGREGTGHLLAEADVIHMRNGIEALRLARPEALEGKVGLVCHWHGTRFREEHAALALAVREAGAIQLVSTLDLTLLEPDVSWCPSPIDLDEMATYRARALAVWNDGPVRIAHAPTNRKVKATKEFMDAVLKLPKGSAVFDLVEKASWSTVLERKAKADVYADQLELGYGNNALEAWAMGIPVLAGIADVRVRDAMLKRFGDLPFYEANRTNLVERLGALVADDALRAVWGLVGFEHTRKFHDERAVAKLLAGVYRQAYERTH
jgi:hypothetical protein